MEHVEREPLIIFKIFYIMLFEFKDFTRYLTSNNKAIKITINKNIQIFNVKIEL